VKTLYEIKYVCLIFHVEPKICDKNALTFGNKYSKIDDNLKLLKCFNSMFKNVYQWILKIYQIYGYYFKYLLYVK
jgi:hypothetical protein